MLSAAWIFRPNPAILGWNLFREKLKLVNMAWTRISLALALAAFAMSCGGPVYQARPHRHPRRAVTTFGAGSSRPIGIAPRLIVVDAVPPAPLYEEPAAPPFTDAYWVSGYWDWTGDEWIWIPGHWEVAPAGYVWIGPTYNNYGTYCEYTGGFWQRREDREQEAYVPPTRVSPPTRSSGETRGRPVAPTVRIQRPRESQPTYTADPTPVTRETFEPQPTSTPRVEPSVTPPVQAQRPTARPTPRSRQWEDLDVAPRNPSRIVPDSRPVARQPNLRQPDPRPSFSPPPAARPPVYTPPPAAPAARSSSPAFTPAPRFESRSTPRVQSYTPPPSSSNNNNSKPAAKPQTFSPAPMKANKK
jgi:hypothetical protein